MFTGDADKDMNYSNDHDMTYGTIGAFWQSWDDFASERGAML
jgi:hypothetical protein